jgi:hypothetical protein
VRKTGRRVGRGLRLVSWALGLPALACAVPGCRGELSEAALHETLAGWFHAQGIAIDAARCPAAPLPRAAGESVECRVSIGAEEVEVTVVVDDEGGLSVRPRHATVVAARAEPEIAQTLRAQGYAVAEVRCEGQVWVARAGAEHRCEVVDDQGRRFAWLGEWSGEGTRQRTRVVPLPAAAGGAP